MKTRNDFLSEEDLDLRNLSWDELQDVWDAWLHAAQATNEEDKYLYSHGVFLVDPRHKNAEEIERRLLELPPKKA